MLTNTNTATTATNAKIPAFTWYYAAPTMHQLILQYGRDEGYIDAKTGTSRYPLKMIANAAGGLLPSLALEMRTAFGNAHVLPSYGMTECMPISSPPPNYRLEKPGTSGMAVGPQVAILNTSTLESVPIGQEGPICVRGEPCFRGYGKIVDDDDDKSNSGGKRGGGKLVQQTSVDGKNATFLPNGWFNTGDLGYLDADGYLFITGRSKEVINRGGEIISPMEVEEAVTGHADIAMCAAFSALHNVLQEVVGIAICMKPGRPRLDLASLHEFLGDLLAGPKWPQCIVFMDNGLPKSHTNKLLRVKLNARLQLPELTDAMHTSERTFEATCPPQGTSLDTPIPARRVTVDITTISAGLSSMVPSLLANADNKMDPNEHHHFIVTPHPTRIGAFTCYLDNIDRTIAIDWAIQNIHRYLVPTHFVETDMNTFVSRTFPAPKMTDAVASIRQGAQSLEPVDAEVQIVQEMFIEMLDLDYIPNPDANFFHLGGSSMLASQFASKIRKRFAIACSGSEVFQHATAKDMGQMIQQRTADLKSSNKDNGSGMDDTTNKKVSHHGAPFESKRLPPENSFTAALFQLLPMFFVFPLWQVTRYLLFFCLLLWSISNVPGDRDIGRFIFAYLAFHTIWITITPLIFVAIKWIVIGRYQPGRYPIWGSYYLRWWFVDVCRKLFLRGIWGGNEVTLNLYYSMLGAKIGKGSRISLECDVAEFDLVEVGEGAAVEFATLRGFGVDNGAMILGPVRVGNFASLGTKSVVAPYTSIPDHGHLCPVTSSYEIGEALDIKHARVNRRCLPEPKLWLQIFLVGPISFFVNVISQIPPFVVLYFMLEYKGDHDSCFSTLNDLMRWLCDPHRIPYYIGIRLARAIFSPFFYMAAAIAVKKTIIGKFKPGLRDTQDQWQLVRHTLAATLFSRARIQEIADLVGRHYEIVSMLYRCLGAKVGSRVFWPGHQPVCSGEFDLLEIGDDVVFGSRSSIFMTTIDSCKKVILCAGSNVADNCVVLPGSIIGKNAVLGSNSLCPEDWYLLERSIWLGSAGGRPSCLEKGFADDTNKDGHKWAVDAKPGTLVMVGDASTLRPFGRAFYLKQANYFVWPMELIVVACFAIKSFIVTFHSLPLLGALHGAAAILYGFSFDERDYFEKYHPIFIYLVVLCMFHWTNLIRVLLWLVIELTAKWTLIGQRAKGRYNYDETSYAQRWELYQMIAKTRKFSRLNFLDFFSGTPFMSAYFRWNGGTIGKDCCMYPAGADPFMSEPDLVDIGDRCVVDCASIVSHLNTRGNFELVPIVLEQDCTLRTRSRVQQGVHMEQGSQILEKSLALTGEVIEAFSVWQGSPAAWWFQYDDNAMEREEPGYNESSLLLTNDHNKNRSFYYSV